MKRGIKITAVLLAILLAATLAACAGDSSGDGGGTPPPSTATPQPPSGGDTDEPPIDPGFDYTGGLPDGVVTLEPITLKVYQYALDNQSTDFANLWYFNELEAETNVSIDWTVIKEGEWNEKLNMMFVSGDYPDLIIRPNNSLNIEEYGVEQGILIPLDGYIQANMPNYAPRMEMSKDSLPVLRSSDGKMYYIGYMSAQGVNHNANWFVNKTWLDAVGKDIPKTIDDLTDVLKAFRDQKPGTGENNFPISAGGEIYHQTNGIYTYFSMFGVPLQYFVYAHIDDNGTVVFPGYMDGFREAVEWLNMCWDEGLLDKESLTQSDDAKNSKVNNDEVGFITYLRLINTAWANPGTIENWVSILPPAAGRGAVVPRDIETEFPSYGAVLTSANKYIPQTLRWLDKQFETERMLVATNGPAQPGAPIDPCLFINDDGLYEVAYIPDDNGLYNYVPVTQGQFFAPGDYIFNTFVMPPHRIERYESSVDYEAAGVVAKNSYWILTRFAKPTPEEATQQSRYYEDIHTFMRERIASFIMNGVTDASWQAFIDDSKGVGVEQYIETYQRLYDAYLLTQGG